MAEKKARTFVKTLTWRIISTIMSFTTSVLLFKSLEESIKFTIVVNILSFLLYYIHERVWNSLKWGNDD